MQKDDLNKQETAGSHEGLDENDVVVGHEGSGNVKVGGVHRDGRVSDKDNVPDAGEARALAEVAGSGGIRTDNSIWLDVLALIGVFLVANLIGGLVALIINKWAHADPEFGTFVSYVTAFGLTIAFAVWQWRRRGTSKLRLRFSLKTADPVSILWGLLLVIVTSVVLEPLLNIFPAEYLENLQKNIGTGGWAIMTTIVAAPILEEVLFRGILQQSLTEKLGGWRGVLAASAVFGIVHVIPQQMINAFFIGIILGYIYIKTRSLVPVILIHAINNVIAFIQMIIFGDDEVATIRQMVHNDVIYWIVYGVFCVIFVIAIFNLWQQLRKLPVGEAVK